MKDKTQTFLLKATIIIGLMTYLVLYGEQIKQFIPEKILVIIFAFCIALAPILLILRIISKVFIAGFRGQPVEFIEKMYAIYYVFLTKEARIQWKEYIESEKRKENFSLNGSE